MTEIKSKTKVVFRHGNLFAYKGGYYIFRTVRPVRAGFDDHDAVAASVDSIRVNKRIKSIQQFKKLI